MKDDFYWMGKALALARKAEAIGEVPIGALVIKDDVVVGRGFNKRESLNDPSAHAEMIAIRQASRKMKSWRLLDTTLYVTLEPCPMCIGAALLARVKKVVFGCFDPKGGATGSLYNLAGDPRFNHSMEVESGVMKDECAEILSTFFRKLREEKKLQGR